MRRTRRKWIWRALVLVVVAACGWWGRCKGREGAVVRTGGREGGGDHEKGRECMQQVHATTTCHGDSCIHGLYSAAGRGVTRGDLPTTHKRRPATTTAGWPASHKKQALRQNA